MINDTAISQSIEILKAGKTLLYPTDTVWGLGCDATNEQAIERIYELKKRPKSKSFILLIHDIAQLYDYVKDIPEVAWDIVEYSEIPLTVIYPQGRNLPKNVLGPDGSVAIRLVKEGPCLPLLKKFRKAIVSTSANISGAPSPANFGEITPDVLNGVDYVVNCSDARLAEGRASRIIRLEMDGTFELIRK